MKISFIGFGNIAKAIAQGLCNNNYQIFAFSPSLKKGIRADGIKTTSDNLEVLVEADIIILAVKPANMAAVLAEIKTQLPQNCLLISVAAGLSLPWLEKQAPEGQAIIRSMPNTPIAVGKGATLLIANKQVTSKQRQWAETIFQCSGIVAWTDQEKEMDPFTALAGSGPAYVFLF